MRLRDYLKENQITEAAFAGEIGVTQAAVNRYCRGDRHPRRQILDRIAEKTMGAVTYADFSPVSEAA